MKKVVLLIFCWLATLYGYAQDAVSTDDNGFRRMMNGLVSKGNVYYETSDRFGILRMADSISYCLRQRSLSGKLDETDSLEYTADWYKLMGSYHYENSYYDEASYKKAHDSYQKALEIYRKGGNFDGNLNCEPMIHRELAQLYYKQANYQEAYSHTKMAYDAFLRAYNMQEIGDDDPDFLDIQTQMAICQARMGKYQEAVPMMDKLIKQYQPSDIRYGEALRKKAKILMLQEEQGGKGSRAEALKCYRAYFDLKKQDALAHFLGMGTQEREQYWMRVRPFVVDCYRLEDADAGFLYDVTLFAKGLLLQLDSAGGGRQHIHATWQMIQERLKPDACAIEFVQYEKYGQQQMGALVLKKTGEPVFVKMAQPDSVMGYVINDRTVRTRLADTSGNNHTAIDAVYNDSAGVYHLVWNEELIRRIGDCKKVYFAPDGYQHRMAIEYMLPQEANGKELFRLTSTRRLLDQPQSVADRRALVVGDVNYSAKSVYVEGQNDEVAYRKMGNLHFGNLKMSKEEIDKILLYRNYPQDHLLSGDGATESEFRRLCPQYPIIHVSSHGKLNTKGIPFGTDLKPCQNDSSLSESTIAFAGINTSLADEAFDPRKQQDGILSSKEMAALDMKGVELVVLSCCETGLGQVTADGVYGIQRGLKNAGAGAIVLTLWEVSDDENTNLFMAGFHRRMKEGKPIGQAFRETRQEDFLSKDDYSVNRPCYRDVFILIDAIE